MKIELYHASVFGNGAAVAQEIKRILETKGHQVNVHHINESKPKALPSADLYIFGSPTRFGGPLGKMRRFITKVQLPSATKYAMFATHADAVPDKKTGRVPTEEELNQMRKTLPTLEGILNQKGMVKVADKVFLVNGTTLKGPLLDDWQGRAEEFAAAILG